MSLISVARNAARWLGFDLGRDDGHVAQAVVVIDPATGEAGAHGLTDAQLRASAVPVSLAATPGLTDAQLRATAIPTTDSLGGTRAFNWANNVREAIAYIRGRIGTPYGLLDLLSFLLPFRVSWSGWDFCSEVISAALRLPKPWHKSPGNLFDWAMLQPGARIVPDDELLIPWSAS